MRAPPRTALAALVALTAVFLLASFCGLLLSSGVRAQIIKDKVAQGNATQLYNFFVAAEPSLDGRPFYGNASAQITIAVYSIPGSAADERFMKDVFPQLNRDFIQTGAVRFYHKNYVTYNDIAQRTDTFIYAAALSCMEHMDAGRYWDFYFALNGTNTSGLGALAQGMGVQPAAWRQCMASPPMAQITQDMQEVENYGIKGLTPHISVSIDGIDPTDIDGVPPYADLQTLVRQRQILLGD